ncbi:MAG: filamentous hemagglutinin N-terminal domain-containing protein [Nitrospira sp.]|nr:filamentous hemagglutinin N-terminal domain-containing protein [Nitrospira sp.]
MQYDITGGTRPNGGPNLFHSFGEFGVPNNAIANFLNNPHVETTNILGRVTGGHISNIFGAIQTDGFEGANLFLMNPAGFLFGPNAAIHVGGMVSFTSADYLKFEDGKKFNAIPSTTDALLSASPVAAFGFLGSNPEAITVQGSHLAVTDGTGISLVGGNITIESGANLSAPNGKIQLASTASPGAFDALTLQANPNVNGASFTSSSSVSLAPGSTVNLSGKDTVSIRGGQFVLSVNDAALNTAGSAGAPNSISLSPGSSIISSTASAEPGADMQITTATLQMDQAQVISRTTGSKDAGSVEIHALNSIHTTDSFISSSSNSTAEGTGAGGQIVLQAPLVEISGGGLSSVTLGSGNAGNISIQTSVLNLSASGGTGEPAEINASTSGPGHGGNISIQGAMGPGSRANAVTLSNFSSLQSETLNGRGTAGNITVETVRLTLTEGSDITTASRLNSSGNAGNITLNATESILLSGSFVTSNALEGSIGHGGNITITTNDLTVGQNTEGRGGLISTSTTSPKNAGTITINTDRMVLIDGGRLSSNSALPDDPILLPPDGGAGTIRIQGVNGHGSRTNSIVIRGQDGFGASSGISTDTRGTGPGGNITVNANSIALQNGGKLSVETLGTKASAVGGTITVNANNVQLNSGAAISANSTGQADAGNINITATDGLTMQNSSITTRVDLNGKDTNARGGNIKITTSPEATVYLRDNSVISASVPGRGDGGNITIDPKFVVLQNSQILTQADRGRGGTIRIFASMFQPDAISVVNADAGRGVNGTVTIQSPYAPAGGKIQPLGYRPLQAAALLNQRCAALAGGEFSSFTVARNRLPIEPGGWLSSPLALAISESHGDAMNNKSLQASLDEPMGERFLLSLRQIVPPGFLTQTFAIDKQGCKS